MRGKNIAVLSSSAAMLVSGWMSISAGTLTTLVVAGGGATFVIGCSADRSDSRQDARTGARTEQRVEDRRD